MNLVINNIYMIKNNINFKFKFIFLLNYKTSKPWFENQINFLTKYYIINKNLKILKILL